jgi:hypothetical protein
LPDSVSLRRHSLCPILSLFIDIFLLSIIRLFLLLSLSCASAIFNTLAKPTPSLS